MRCHGIATFLVFLVISLLFGELPRQPSLAESGAKLKDSLSISFLLVVSAFWFGCSNSAKEIVKERLLFEKERHAGLNAVGYLGQRQDGYYSSQWLNPLDCFLL